MKIELTADVARNPNATGKEAWPAMIAGRPSVGGVIANTPHTLNNVHPGRTVARATWTSIGCAALLLAAGAAQAQYYHVGSVQDGAGGTSDNTVPLGGRQWRHVSAGAQPGGIQAGTAGGIDHRAGFLQAIEVRRWDLDSDGDGVPDELSNDNDGDSLHDLAELDGSAFEGYAVTDLNNPDTDGDGMRDGDESAGLYDPLDPEHRLAILTLGLEAGHQRLAWVGKGGGTINAIYHAADLVDEPFTNVLHSGPYAGGAAPWYKTTNTYTWLEDEALRFFHVRTER